MKFKILKMCVFSILLINGYSYGQADLESLVNPSSNTDYESFFGLETSNEDYSYELEDDGRGDYKYDTIIPGNEDAKYKGNYKKGKTDTKNSNKDYLNTIDATRINPSVKYNEFMNNVKNQNASTIEEQNQLRTIFNSVDSTAKQLALDYCGTIKSGQNRSNGGASADTVYTDETLKVLDEAADAVAQQLSDYWRGFSKERETAQLTGDLSFDVTQTVTKTNEGLNKLKKDKLKGSSMEQLRAEAFSECMGEMSAYYKEAIINTALQNVKMNEYFRKAQRELYEIQNQQANYDLTRSIQRHIAGADIYDIDPSELVEDLSDDQIKKRIEQEMQRRSDEAKDHYVAFLDGTIVYGDGTSAIVGKRGTLPHIEEETNIVKSAFFYTIPTSNSEQNIYGLESMLFGSSNDPLLTLLIVSILGDVSKMYDKAVKGNSDLQKALAKISLPGLFINNVCTVNYALSKYMQEALLAFSEQSSNKLASSISRSAGDILNNLIDNIAEEYDSIYSDMLKRAGYSQGTGNMDLIINSNSFSLDSLVNNVIIPAYEEYGAYSDIMAYVNRGKKDNNVDKGLYAAAYLHTLGDKSGFYEEEYNRFALYMNKNFARVINDAVLRYLAKRKQYELSMMNEPIFESVNTDIIHVNQMNAINNVKLQIDTEYSGFERLIPLRCLFK
jgi:hypothetical protein